jgi:hypothetical protein
LIAFTDTSKQYAVNPEPNPAEEESPSAFHVHDLGEYDSLQDEHERHASQDTAKERHSSPDAGEKGTNANEKGKDSQRSRRRGNPRYVGSHAMQSCCCVTFWELCVVTLTMVLFFIIY